MPSARWRQGGAGWKVPLLQGRVREKGKGRKQGAGGELGGTAIPLEIDLRIVGLFLRALQE